MRLFDVVGGNKPKRNLFDLSHEKKLTANFGDLIPILVQEVVPGDSFKISTDMLVRVAPMLAPAMVRMNAHLHYFFVPNRIVWDNWENFITGGKDGTLNPTFPKLAIGDGYKDLVLAGSLADYFGVPVAKDTTTVISNPGFVSALPFRAYHRIYDEYYRDQTLMTEVGKYTGDIVYNQENIDLLTMRTRCWEKDYFTSCLPWTQRGPEVVLPTTNDITYKPGQTLPEGTTTAGNITVTSTGAIQRPDGSAIIDNIEEITSQITINDLRLTARLQEWLENNARGGSRYIEQILAHFGVVSDDARLQRPEFLGGTKQPIVISEVLATFNGPETDGGTMYGHGVSAGSGKIVKKYFKEHGTIIGILSILPRSSYLNQGIDKSLTKFDKFDYYFPEFAQLGEQPVLDAELYYDYYAPEGEGRTTFGYQSRFAEYKFKNSTVHGDFKTDLAYWHLARIFSNKPALNEDFVKCDSSLLTRLWPVTNDTNKFYVQLYNRISAVRPMPIFNRPRL